ncbi:polysaccharide lyase 8 family protein [Actinopolymorpha cephalotaxi]
MVVALLLSLLGLGVPPDAPGDGDRPSGSSGHGAGSSGSGDGSSPSSGSFESADSFDTLRQRWKDSLDGGPGLNVQDPDVARRITALTEAGRGFWESMDTTPDTYVWSDLADVSANGYAIDATYIRLRAMTLALSTAGSPLHGDVRLRDDIITALDWVNTHWYNDTTVARGNWWEWYIGAPNRLKDITVMLYDQLSPAQLHNYTAALDHFVPSDIGNWRGANATDILVHQLVSGVLQKSGERVANVRNLIPPLLDYATSGVGFYEDGSYIDHVAVPYNLSYGKEHLNSLSNIVYLLSGSPWDISAQDAGKFYATIYNGYEPLIYKGAGMDMVRGRAIGRNIEQDHDAGHAVIANIATIATVAPPEHAARFKAMIKSWVGADTYRNFYAAGNSRATLFVVTTVKEIMADPAITPRPEPVGHFAYNSMDRTVHRARGFAFAIAKSSKRVLNYEQMNNENAKAWYTGDGMTYLYNDDLGQFAGNFWPTVDMTRLPGTTTEVRPRFRGNPEGNVQNGDGEGVPANSWSGGSVLGDYGASGMHLRPVGGVLGGSLSARKSWFMFDDEVVALGSDIRTTSPAGRRVETVVENRKLNADGTNRLVVDGVAEPSEPGWSRELADVSWINLGANPGSDVRDSIGYYFPGGATVDALRDTRTGRWSDLSANGTGGPAYTNHFMTLTMDHGVDPAAASYSYVLLPNRTPAQTRDYARRPDIAVLANTDAVHAVRENTLGVTGYNFWTDAATGAGDVTSNRRASVMTREVAGDTFEIAVNDPTRENAGTIDIEIDRAALSLVSGDPRITVTQLSPTIKLAVDVDAARGKSFTAKFRLR